MKDYSKLRGKIPSIQERAIEKEFKAHFRNTLEGFECSIDNMPLRAIIQKHTNPIHSHLEDKLMIALEKESSMWQWGSYVKVDDEDKNYITLTAPESTDGVTLKAKIRKAEEVCKFKIDGVEYEYNCIGTNQLLYENGTYTTDTVVFTENDRRAIVIPLDEVTNKLGYIEEIIYQDLKFRTILIDKLTDDGVTGVIQLVILRTVEGDVTVNGEPLKDVIFTFARMKDKKLNSKSRQIITKHGTLKSGDYVTHVYNRGEREEKDTYINITLTDMNLDYDIIYCYKCESSFNIWDEENKCPVTIPCYVDDNFIRLENEDGTYLSSAGSTYRITVQENKFTTKLLYGIKRIIMRGRAYEITGIDNISLENIIYISLIDSQIDPNNDNLEYMIADFKGEDKQDDLTKLEIVGEDMCIISCDYQYKVDEPIIGIWSIEQGSEYCDYNMVDDKFEIVIKDKVSYIGKEIIIRFTKQDGSYVEKTVTIKGWR